jgi:hypothetical protein
MKLTCIVYGEEYSIETEEGQSLIRLRETVLTESLVTGRPYSHFELRNDKGVWLNPLLTTSEAGLRDGDILWVTPAIAAGGSNKINHRRKHQRIKTDCRYAKGKRQVSGGPCRNTSGHYHNGVRWMKREGVRTCRRAGWPTGTVRYIQPYFRSPSKLRALMLSGE